MEKALLDVIFVSERRMNVLLMLQDGPKEMELILESLRTTRMALLPQMRILKDHHLIYQSDDAYGLTITGKMMANKMKPFLSTVEVLEEHSSYLATHKVDSIPEHLLMRINEINGCTIMEPSHVNVHELNADYRQEALGSKAVYFVFTFMHPSCPWILDLLVKAGVDVYIIFTKELVQKLKDELYDKFKSFILCGKVTFYSYNKDIQISSLTVTDNGFLLRLLFDNNEFSNKQLICLSEKGRHWGMDFYNYHLKDSTLITKI
ncbi:helix-turn-helix transcriptional regulator [Methanomethylovorans sp.]|uniref:helix-turn-helix transcriptional regulator n=1 Tax=Methanomethylovorans sp. TaxID=2758717 RepID=UPI00351BF67D